MRCDAVRKSAESAALPAANSTASSHNSAYTVKVKRNVQMKISVCIITGYGINADLELAEAFRRAGADTSRVHVNDIIEAPASLSKHRIIAFPGGFSFGDHIGSGKVFGNLFKKKLKGVLDEFVASGSLVIGICNGFQVLVKMGILPNIGGGWKQEVSLIHNDSGTFEDRWVLCRFESASSCVWTRGLGTIELPVRHGEGKFVIGSDDIERTLQSEKLAAVTYASRSGDPVTYPENPNGSTHDIAGICDRTGHVFGLMPHPEAYIFAEQHPRWTREPVSGETGLALFRNAVEYFT